jgi:hypothetical protein
LLAELGTQQTSYGPKPQLLLMFELLDEVMSSGKPFLLARRYTLTSDPMGSLRQDLEGWFGKTLTDEALAQINLTQLLGAVAQIAVKHETRGDRTYANIVSLSPPTRGTPQRAEATTGFLAFSLSEPFAASRVRGAAAVCSNDNCGVSRVPTGSRWAFGCRAA